MKDDNKVDIEANKRAADSVKKLHDEKLGFTPCTSTFIKFLSKYIPEYK